MRRLAAAITVTLALSCVAGGCARPAPPGAPPTVRAEPTTFTGMGSEPHPGFPTGTISWHSSAPPLPADRPVGPASLLLVNLDQVNPEETGTHLVMPDGSQWALPSGSTTATLSPNGRWLGYRDGSTFVFRDLTGTGVLSAPAFAEPRPGAMWSPNGRWLLGITSTLLDFDSGDTVSLPETEDVDGAPVGSGEIVRDRCRDTGREELTVHAFRSLARPQRLDKVTFDATPYLHGGEQVVKVPTGQAAEDNEPECWFRAGPRDLGYLAVYETPATPHNGQDVRIVRAFVVFSLTTGKLVRRVDLPPDRPLDLPRRDTGLSSLGGTLLVLHSEGTAGLDGSELWAVDMTTGAVRTLARFDAGPLPVAPGASGS